MTKFVFELQGVLEIKQKLEGQAKVNFGVARAKLNAEEEKLEGIQKRLAEYRDMLSDTMSGDIDLREVNRLGDAIDIMEEQEVQQKMAVSRAEKQVDLMRTRLNSVMMERKTIEKLREKRFAEYLLEYNAEERKAVDELVSYRHSIEPETEEEQLEAEHQEVNNG